MEEMSTTSARSSIGSPLPLLGLALLLLLAAGCVQTSDSHVERRLAAYPPSGVKVLLVGIDGGTFEVIRPMISQGRLPVLTQLIETGAHGPLWSEKPMLSPALWTTVVTGQPRSTHGIVDFLQPGTADDPRLFTSTERRSLALWNLTAPFGRTVGFAGWWTSWPAETVDGWLLSDRMVRTRWSEWTQGPQQGGATYPPELANELRELVVDPLDPPVGELEELARFTDSEIEEMVTAPSPIFGHGPSVLKFAWSAQRSYEQMVGHLVQSSQPDLLGILLIATDPASHTFWHHFEPARFRGANRADARRLGPLIPNVYAHDDRFLGGLLETLDPQTVTLVISDHGFQASGKLPQPRSGAELEDQLEGASDIVAVGQPGRHALQGILIASGGPIRQGIDVKATLYDIAPTILALLGMPVPDDMTGRVLEEILEPRFLDEHPIRRIPSYADLVVRTIAEPSEAVDDPEAMEMLRSLGYVQ